MNSILFIDVYCWAHPVGIVSHGGQSPARKHRESCFNILAGLAESSLRGGGSDCHHLVSDPGKNGKPSTDNEVKGGGFIMFFCVTLHSPI